MYFFFFFFFLSTFRKEIPVVVLFECHFTEAHKLCHVPCCCLWDYNRLMNSLCNTFYPPPRLNIKVFGKEVITSFAKGEERTDHYGRQV